MRIASLVPSATEMLFALGVGEAVVAVTHECDWPVAAQTLPKLTRSVFAGDPVTDPAAIDARVRELVAAGQPLYELDGELLERLAVDLIVSQQLCAVCAVSHPEVCEVAAGLACKPEVLALDPTGLDEVFDQALELGERCGAPSAGRQLRASLAARVGAIAAAVASAPERPAVVALEWLDPPFLGGHWVPEMIERAGGRDPLGRAGERSRTADWEEIAAAEPEIVVVMPCGLYLDQAHAAAERFAANLAAIGADRYVAVDAAASFSRPGPRLADGVELLGHLIHPTLVPAPNPGRGQLRHRPIGLG